MQGENESLRRLQAEPTTPSFTGALHRFEQRHAACDALHNQVQRVQQEALHTATSMAAHVHKQLSALQQRHVEVQLQLEDTLEQLGEAQQVGLHSVKHTNVQHQNTQERRALREELECLRAVLQQVRASEAELLGGLARSQKHVAALAGEKEELRAALAGKVLGDMVVYSSQFWQWYTQQGAAHKRQRVDDAEPQTIAVASQLESIFGDFV